MKFRNAVRVLVHDVNIHILVCIFLVYKSLKYGTIESKSDVEYGNEHVDTKGIYDMLRNLITNIRKKQNFREIWDLDLTNEQKQAIVIATVWPVNNANFFQRKLGSSNTICFMPVLSFNLGGTFYTKIVAKQNSRHSKENFMSIGIYRIHCFKICTTTIDEDFF